MDLYSGTALDLSRTHCSLLSLVIDTTVFKFPYTLQNTFSAMGFSSKINLLLLLDFGPSNHMTSNSSKFSSTSRLQSWSTSTVPVYYEQSIECIPIVPMLFFFLSFFLSQQWRVIENLILVWNIISFFFFNSAFYFMNAAISSLSSFYCIFTDPNSLWFLCLGKNGVSYFMDYWENWETSLPQRPWWGKVSASSSDDQWLWRS